MCLLHRAVASGLVVATVLSASPAFAKAPGRDVDPPGRRVALAHVPPEAARHATAFAEAVGASVVARAAPFPPAVVRSAASALVRSAPNAVVRSAPSAGLRGIDVSHYQGRIDWRRVARSGHHFVIAKATEGRTYIDRTYLRNKAQAEANDLAFGAYHFARPDKGRHDPIREANHFLDVARLEPGNVIPVLDLETTGGLSKRRLTRWILTWLRRVRERLGVRPMVYTSPMGWAERTGDTTAIVEAGYEVLWVAHWGVPEPTLPAGDWGGHGWTLWQRSDCGRVPGIRGCVDVNRLAGRSLAALTIMVPDTRPPSVRVSRATSVTSPVAVSFDEVVGGVSPQNVSLRSPGTDRAAGVRLECRSGIGWAVDCSSGDVRNVVLTPRRPLVPGETYEAVVNAAPVFRAVVDRAGNPAPAVVRAFAAPTELEQGSAAITYRRARAWRTIAPRERRGSRVAASGVAGARAELTFHGTGVVWSTVNGPNHGLAAIWIDGRYVRLVDTYSRQRVVGVTHRVSGLDPGIHSLRVVVLGDANPGASGTMVAVDRVRVLPEA